MPQMARMGRVEELVVHHSGTEGGDVETFRREHRKRGFADVAYHAVITPGGEVQPGRKEEFQGAGVKRANRGKLHVCLVGNFSETEPTQAQLVRLGEWLLNRSARYGLREQCPVPIRGHAEAALPQFPTDCPGAWLHERMHLVRLWHHQRVVSATRADLATFLAGRCFSAEQGRASIDTSDCSVAADVGHLALPERAVRVEVRGYVSDLTKRTFEPAAVEVGGRVFVALPDLVEGLGWAEPEAVEEEREGSARRVLVVATKARVREARATLSGAPRELGGAE